MLLLSIHVRISIV